MQEGGEYSSMQEFPLLKFDHSFEFWVPVQEVSGHAFSAYLS